MFCVALVIHVSSSLYFEFTSFCFITESEFFKTAVMHSLQYPVGTRASRKVNKRSKDFFEARVPRVSLEPLSKFCDRHQSLSPRYNKFTTSFSTLENSAWMVFRVQL